MSPADPIPAAAFRRALLAWYDSARRDLPWREPHRAPGDFYVVWVSEIMLQQTRVEAVIPYFRRFLSRFPDVRALAGAPEAEVLAAWSGLGYYSRARNLHLAAQHIAAHGAPATHAAILNLPGVGAYTAAAVASIALGLPYAAVDGNVIRVVSRLTGDWSEISSPRVRARFAQEAQRLLDPARPGDFNQALMELGATVCLPRTPRCGDCPVRRFCAGLASGRAEELPVRPKKPAVRETGLALVAFFQGDRIFLSRRGGSEKRLAGFWELPEAGSEGTTAAEPAAAFTHRIVNDRFRVSVRRAPAGALPSADGRWFGPEELRSVPVTTVTRKALAALGSAQNRPARAANPFPAGASARPKR